jgi:hypothetical protein
MPSRSGSRPLSWMSSLTDVAHHQLAVAVVFLVAGHLYRTQFSIGTRLTSLLASHRATFVNTWHTQLAINLGFLGTANHHWPPADSIPGLPF